MVPVRVWVSVSVWVKAAARRYLAGKSVQRMQHSDGGRRPVSDQPRHPDDPTAIACTSPSQFALSPDKRPDKRRGGLPPRLISPHTRNTSNSTIIRKPGQRPVRFEHCLGMFHNVFVLMNTHTIRFFFSSPISHLFFVMDTFYLCLFTDMLLMRLYKYEGDILMLNCS